MVSSKSSRNSLAGSSKSSSSEQGTSAPRSQQPGRDAIVLIRTYLPSRDSEPSAPPPYSQLLRPICIPQISLHPKWDSAFARGYSQALADAGISQEDFLNFIDGLNLAMAASPPLRVVDVAGIMLSFVPLLLPMLAGVIISAASQTSMRKLSKTLTDHYLRAANLQLFNPRGLSVRICTTRAMTRMFIQQDLPTSQPSKLNRMGRFVGSMILQTPLVGQVLEPFIRAVSHKPPIIQPSEGPTKNSALRRRLAQTWDYAAPLQIDGMPPPRDPPEGVRAAMASWGVKFEKTRQEKEEQKNEDRRRALAAQRMGIDLRTWNLQVDGGMRREYSRQVKQHEERRSGSRPGLLGHVFESRMTEMERKVASADLLEHWADDGVLWLVIMSSENDARIEGIGLAEDPAEEQTGEYTWRSDIGYGETTS
ncbi:hypothetical protein VNI00_008058 [Paramarasmius palmivorus]|uniref:Uncharacterized protein n=1 Tax=Paramarasmius palmivorus TaxID=297713 RepID=A0AAW0CYU2_9AGAR